MSDDEKKALILKNKPKPEIIPQNLPKDEKAVLKFERMYNKKF